MGDALVNCLMYADDVVLLSSSKEGLQHSLSSLQKYCDSWNLKINIEKTKILIFNKSGKLLKNDKFFYQWYSARKCSRVQISWNFDEGFRNFHKCNTVFK